MREKKTFFTVGRYAREHIRNHGDGFRAFIVILMVLSYVLCTSGKYRILRSYVRAGKCGLLNFV